MEKLLYKHSKKHDRTPSKSQHSANHNIHQQKQQQQQQQQSRPNSKHDELIPFNAPSHHDQTSKIDHTHSEPDTPLSSTEPTNNSTPQTHPPDIPFCRKDLAGSLINSCTTRQFWLDLCPQLLMVCNEAARRSTLKLNPHALRYDKPLSDTYMAERLAFDTIVAAYTVTTKLPPHFLQGFIVATTFMVFRKSFRFTRDIPAAGITPTDQRLHATDDGSLTTDLQQISRHGSDARNGILFPRVAEIALLGGLGCGGILLSRALSELRQSGDYDYVLLQATKNAIPFYERYGFLRIGTVMRLNDNDIMPEVAYRHWSDIVAGKAEEPSYMMAHKLKSPPLITTHPSSHPPPPSLTSPERKNEIISAMKSAWALLTQAIATRATGSVAYETTYRELVVTARDFIKSADDHDLLHEANLAISLISDESYGESKKMIKKMIRPPHISTSEPCLKKDEETVNLKIRVRCDSCNIQREKLHHDNLWASLPLSLAPLKYNSCIWKPRSISVRVVFDSSSDPQTTDNLGSREAIFCQPPIRQNLLDIQSAMTDGLKNAYSALVEAVLHHENNGENGKKQHTKEDDPLPDPLVHPGDTVVVKHSTFGGCPVRSNVVVERFCTDKERPDDMRANANNSFVVSLEDELDDDNTTHKQIEFPFLLDSSNRGVGRDWCSLKDMYSFPVLPPRLLDRYLIGSWVEAPTDSGDVIKGYVTKRIGSGLWSEPLWTIESERGEGGTRKRKSSDPTIEEDNDNESNIDDDFVALNVSQIRENVEVGIDNLKSALSLLREDIDLYQRIQSDDKDDDDNDDDGESEDKSQTKPTQNDDDDNDAVVEPPPMTASSSSSSSAKKENSCEEEEDTNGISKLPPPSPAAAVDSVDFVSMEPVEAWATFRYLSIMESLDESRNCGSDGKRRRIDKEENDDDEANQYAVTLPTLLHIANDKNEEVKE